MNAHNTSNLAESVQLPMQTQQDDILAAAIKSGAEMRVCFLSSQLSYKPCHISVCMGQAGPCPREDEYNQRTVHTCFMLGLKQGTTELWHEEQEFMSRKVGEKRDGVAQDSSLTFRLSAHKERRPMMVQPGVSFVPPDGVYGCRDASGARWSVRDVSDLDTVIGDHTPTPLRDYYLETKVHASSGYLVFTTKSSEILLDNLGWESEERVSSTGGVFFTYKNSSDQPPCKIFSRWMTVQFIPYYKNQPPSVWMLPGDLDHFRGVLKAALGSRDFSSPPVCFKYIATTADYTESKIFNMIPVLFPEEVTSYAKVNNKQQCWQFKISQPPIFPVVQCKAMQDFNVLKIFPMQRWIVDATNYNKVFLPRPTKNVWSTLLDLEKDVSEFHVDVRVKDQLHGGQEIAGCMAQVYFLLHTSFWIFPLERKEVPMLGNNQMLLLEVCAPSADTCDNTSNKHKKPKLGVTKIGQRIWFKAYVRIPRANTRGNFCKITFTRISDTPPASRKAAEALCMAKHPRLGENSGVGQLPSSVLLDILNHVHSD